MQSLLNEPGTEVWPAIAPLLDDAVAGLREKDRQAIVLRFYEGRNLREVGLALGASEDAAEKRVNRALEKLRNIFRETRCEFDDGHHCRGDFRQFRSSRARGAGKIRDRRGDCQRRGGQRFNLNPHQRSIENYGMDKNENNSRCERGNFTRRRNHGCGLGIKGAGGPQKRLRGL